MTKYRGFVDGKQRGEYRSAQLRAKFENEDMARASGTWRSHTPFSELKAYLSRTGAFLDSHSEHYKIETDESCDSDNATYHYGGATVLVEYFEFTEGERREGEISVRIVSNDPVDDVIERLCRKFPYLNKNQPGQGGENL